VSAKSTGSAVQLLKGYLVKLGPQNPIVQTALRIRAKRHGFRLSFSSSGIEMLRGNRSLLLNNLQFIQVPIMMDCFDLFFTTIRPTSANGRDFLDFSKPGLHEYSNRAVSFYFPSVPEDDVMDAYIKEYKPREGDIVWDVGAHAGATSYFLSQLVGPAGRVYAFEPDEYNYAYLMKNLEMHSLSNVVPVRKALSSSTGQTMFNMDGTMSAGIHEFLTYSGTGRLTKVDTITIADACSQFDCVPNFIKMDIEGAEVAAIEGSAAFIAEHDVSFAVESFHRLGNTYTYSLLDRLFPQLGYEVRSSEYCGQMFTWAKRRS
jgi:FkbM family methyltransferase